MDMDRGGSIAEGPAVSDGVLVQGDATTTKRMFLVTRPIQTGPFNNDHAAFDVAVDLFPVSSTATVYDLTCEIKTRYLNEQTIRGYDVHLYKVCMLSPTDMLSR